jgi:endonuclease YncB( thermonuclease family)
MRRASQGADAVNYHFLIPLRDNTSMKFRNRHQPPPKVSYFSAAGERRRRERVRRRKRLTFPAWAYAATGLGLGAVLGVGIIMWPSNGAAEAPHTAAAIERSFSLCHIGGGRNCVVDGDTIWLDGVKIRVADIDAPETHPSRCQREADLGDRATRRLQELINAGPFEVRPIGRRDQDQYGRKLRVLVRRGESLGDILVAEGLVRTWSGRRERWC